MILNLFKRYKHNKKQPEELKKLKSSIDKNTKTKLIDKLIELETIDKIILKLHTIYKKILDKLFIKYDLKNETKQGKLFTILIGILIFLLLITLTILFVIMLNSLLGINLIYSIIKYSIFLIKCSYKILKNKGKIIKKYLANLFPNSKMLKNKEKNDINDLPIFYNYILKEIQTLILELENLDSDILIIKDLAIQLKDIVNMMNLEKEENVCDNLSLEYKLELLKRINNVKSKIEEIEQKKELEEKFDNIKLETLEEIDMMVRDKVDNKVYILKKKS